MEHKGRWSLTMWILGALVLSCAASAKAQSASGPHWEIGVYGGGAWTSLPGDGDGALPPPGASFTTLGGSQSRRVASWFFGDGALLLNQLQATRPAPFGRSLVVPLDSLLTSSPIRRLSGPSLGVRVSRSLNHRVTLEGSIERGTGSLAFSRTAATVIASTRESVERTIREALPPLTQTVSTATDVRDGRGKSISVLATLKAQLFEWKSLTPFASFGGGWLRHSGRAPSFVAEAVYAVRSTFTAPPVTLTETDRVEVEYSVAKHVPTAAVSAGVDIALSRR